MTNRYLLNSTKFTAFDLFTGRKPNAAETSKLLNGCRNFADLRALLLPCYQQLGAEERQKLKQRKVSATEIEVSFQMLMGRYPINRAAIDLRLERGANVSQFLDSLINSEEGTEYLRIISNLPEVVQSQFPLFVYLHIPKCAGTSFDSFCQRNMGDRFFLDRDKITGTDSFRGKLLIGGHRKIDFFDYLPTPPIYICVVRDPVTRALSNFNYIKHLPENTLRAEFGEDFSLDRPAIDVVMNTRFASQVLFNLQCQYLGAQVDFQAALMSLRQNNVIAVSMQNLHLLPQYLCDHYGFIHAYLPEDNKSTSSYHYHSLGFSLDDIDTIRLANQQDQALYEFVHACGIYDSVSPELQRQVQGWAEG